MKLYTTVVESCVGIIRGYGACPYGHWTDVNRSVFFCSRLRRNVDFKNRKKGVHTDEYIPKWCTLEEVQ